MAENGVQEEPVETEDTKDGAGAKEEEVAHNGQGPEIEEEGISLPNEDIMDFETTEQRTDPAEEESSRPLESKRPKKTRRDG